MSGYFFFFWVSYCKVISKKNHIAKLGYFVPLAIFVYVIYLLLWRLTYNLLYFSIASWNVYNGIRMKIFLCISIPLGLGHHSWYKSRIPLILPLQAFPSGSLPYPSPSLLTPDLFSSRDPTATTLSRDPSRLAEPSLFSFILVSRVPWVLPLLPTSAPALVEQTWIHIGKCYQLDKRHKKQLEWSALLLSKTVLRKCFKIL